MKAPSRVFLALLIPLAIAAGRITGPQAPDPVPIPDPVFISISPERITIRGFNAIPLRFLRVDPVTNFIRLQWGTYSGLWFDGSSRMEQLVAHSNKPPGCRVDFLLNDYATTHLAGRKHPRYWSEDLGWEKLPGGLIP